MKLAEYVMKHAIRGACECGKCFNGNTCPKQPFKGDTINLTMFKVGMKDSPDAVEFLNLVANEYPHWLDGNEHNYLECGGDVGDQGMALMTMGLGHLLDVWQCMCPETMMPFLDDETKRLMAGSGMISIKIG